MTKNERGLRYYKEQGPTQQTQNSLSTVTRDRQPISATARQTEWLEFALHRTTEILQQTKGRLVTVYPRTENYVKSAK